MLFRFVLLSVGLTTAGCTGSSGLSRADDFGPTRLRIHPSFTQVKDWTGDKQPDGVEAVVELLDSYGEPTRGGGTLLFELWGYKKYDPDPRGQRVGGPWKGELLTREQQEMHWSAALRAYTFQLADSKISNTRDFVLTASFQSAADPNQPGGGRIFDQLIIEPPPGKKQEKDGVGRIRGSKP